MDFIYYLQGYQEHLSPFLTDTTRDPYKLRYTNLNLGGFFQKKKKKDICILQRLFIDYNMPV